MSTVFHGFRIPKANIWHVRDEIFKHLKANHLVLKSYLPTEDNLARGEDRARGSGRGRQQLVEDFREWFKDKEAQKFNEVSLLLFDDDTHWIFRVLAMGYQTENFLWGPGSHLVGAFGVDTRVEPPRGLNITEYKKRIARVEALDAEITASRFFIVPIVDEGVASPIFFTYYDAVAERMRKSGEATLSNMIQHSLPKE